MSLKPTVDYVPFTPERIDSIRSTREHQWLTQTLKEEKPRRVKIGPTSKPKARSTVKASQLPEGLPPEIRAKILAALNKS